MSTKTTIKRVALVAAVALTLGGFSAVSASAAPSAAYTTMYDTTNGVQIVGGLATVTISTDTSTVASVVLSGVGSIVSATAGTNTSVTTPAAGTYSVTTTSSGVGSSTVVLTSATAGVSTLTITPYASNGTVGTAVTKTVTWSPTTSISVSAANSTIYAAASSTTIPSASSTTDAAFTALAAKGTGTPVASYLVTLKDGNGNVVTADSVTVTIAGPGLLGGFTDSSTSAIANGNVRAVTKAVHSTRGTASFALYGDGTAGTATLTFADGTTVLGTKTFTFSGGVASLAAVAQAGRLAIAAASTSAGGNNNTEAIKVTAKDSAGNAVSSGTVYATSSDLTVINDTNAQVTITAGVGYYTPSTPLKAGTTNITFADASASATVTSAPVALTVAASKVAASISFAWDAASYNPGDKMTLTATVKDSTGALIADSDTSTGYALLSAAGLVFTQSLASAPAASANVVVKNGVATWTMYAPLAAGTVSVSATTAASGANLATAYVSTAIDAATATIAGSADSALAVDAANAATDAANAAAEEASNATEAASEALAAVNSLATTVASLIAGIKAQLTSLTALIKKIQAKVKA